MSNDARRYPHDADHGQAVALSAETLNIFSKKFGRDFAGIWESKARADAFKGEREAWGRTLDEHGIRFVSAGVARSPPTTPLRSNGETPPPTARAAAFGWRLSLAGVQRLRTHHWGSGYPKESVRLGIQPRGADVRPSQDHPIVTSRAVGWLTSISGTPL